MLLWPIHFTPSPPVYQSTHHLQISNEDFTINTWTYYYILLLQQISNFLKPRLTTPQYFPFFFYKSYVDIIIDGDSFCFYTLEDVEHYCIGGDALFIERGRNQGFCL